MSDLGGFGLVIVSALAGISGVAVAYGVLRQQVKSVQDATKAIKDELSWLRMGGVGGTTIYTSRVECDQYRNECLAVRTSTLENLQAVLSEHTSAIRRLENVFRWILTEKEGLSLTAINQILSGEEL